MGFLPRPDQENLLLRASTGGEILRRSPVLEVGKGLIAVDARRIDRLLMISALETRMLAVPWFGFEL